MGSSNVDVDSNDSLPPEPKPVGITMYNIMHPGHKRLRSDLTFSNSRVGQDAPQLEHNWSTIQRQNFSLLVQLDLVIHASTVWLLQQLYMDFGMDNVDLRALFGLQCAGDLKQNNDLVVLHSEAKNIFQSYPHWGLIDEVIFSWYSKLPKLCGSDKDVVSFERRLWNEFYRAINVKVSHLEDQRNLSHHSLSEIFPLYHDDLSTLPSDCSSVANDNLTSSVLGISKFSSAVPASLPPNSILITYTDGSTRVRHELFTLLLKRGVIHEVSEDGREKSMTETKTYSKRFDDRTFDVLDNLGNLEEEGEDVPTLKSNRSAKKELARKTYKMRDELMPVQLQMPHTDDAHKPSKLSPVSNKSNTRPRHEDSKSKEANLKKEIEFLRQLNEKEKSNLEYDTSALVTVCHEN